MQTDDAAIVAALRPLIASAEQPMAPSRRQRYAATANGARYSLTEEGDLLAELATPSGVRDTIYQRCHQRAFELAQLKGWRLLHGALVDVERRRLLLVGKPAHRTAVALRLTLGGAAIQGADSLLVRDGLAFAIPRPLVLSPNINQLMPELMAILPRLPRVGGVALLDPARDLGLDWRLRVAAVDALALIEDGAGEVVCQRREPVELLAAIARAAAPAEHVPPELLAAITELLATARCHRLAGGDPRAMERAIRRLG